MSKTGRWRPARTGRMWAAPTARARALSLSPRWTGGRCGQVARCGKVDRWQRLTPPCACHKLAPDPAPASGEATSEWGAESLGAQQQPGQPRAAAANPLAGPPNPAAKANMRPCVARVALSSRVWLAGIATKMDASQQVAQPGRSGGRRTLSVACPTSRCVKRCGRSSACRRRSALSESRCALHAGLTPRTRVRKVPLSSCQKSAPCFPLF
jgi:hypothetical protein